MNAGPFQKDGSFFVTTFMWWTRQAALSSQRMREVEEWIWKAEAGEVCHWAIGWLVQKQNQESLGLTGTSIYHKKNPFNLDQSRRIKCILYIYCIIHYNTVYTRIKSSYQSLLTGTVDGCGTRYLQERLKTYQDYCKWTDSMEVRNKSTSGDGQFLVRFAFGDCVHIIYYTHIFIIYLQI